MRAKRCVLPCVRRSSSSSSSNSNGSSANEQSDRGDMLVRAADNALDVRQFDVRADGLTEAEQITRIAAGLDKLNAATQDTAAVAEESAAAAAELDAESKGLAITANDLGSLVGR